MRYPQFFVATRQWKHLGIWAGDTVRYDPTSSPEITVVRYLPPNHGALLLAIEDGALTPVSGALGELASPSAAAPPSPSQPGSAASVPGGLRVVK
jgi:hypothetical protein